MPDSKRPGPDHKISPAVAALIARVAGPEAEGKQIAQRVEARMQELGLNDPQKFKPETIEKLRQSLREFYQKKVLEEAKKKKGDEIAPKAEAKVPDKKDKVKLAEFFNLIVQHQSAEGLPQGVTLRISGKKKISITNTQWNKPKWQHIKTIVSVLKGGNVTENAAKLRLCLVERKAETPAQKTIREELTNAMHEFVHEIFQKGKKRTEAELAWALSLNAMLPKEMGVRGKKWNTLEEWENTLQSAVAQNKADRVRILLREDTVQKMELDLEGLFQTALEHPTMDTAEVLYQFMQPTPEWLYEQMMRFYERSRKMDYVKAGAQRVVYWLETLVDDQHLPSADVEKTEIEVGEKKIMGVRLGGDELKYSALATAMKGAPAKQTKEFTRVVLKDLFAPLLDPKLRKKGEKIYITEEFESRMELACLVLRASPYTREILGQTTHKFATHRLAQAKTLLQCVQEGMGMLDQNQKKFFEPLLQAIAENLTVHPLPQRTDWQEKVKSQQDTTLAAIQAMRKEPEPQQAMERKYEEKKEARPASRSVSPAPSTNPASPRDPSSASASPRTARGAMTPRTPRRAPGPKGVGDGMEV